MTHGVGVQHAQVDALLLRCLGNLGGLAHLDAHGVKEGGRAHAQAQLLGACGEAGMGPSLIWEAPQQGSTTEQTVSDYEL